MKSRFLVWATWLVAGALVASISPALHAAFAVAVTPSGGIAYAWGEKDTAAAMKQAAYLASVTGTGKEKPDVIYGQLDGGYGAIAVAQGARGKLIYGVGGESLTRSLAEKKALKKCAELGGKGCVLAWVWYDHRGMARDMVADVERGKSTEPGFTSRSADVVRREVLRLPGN